MVDGSEGVWREGAGEGGEVAHAWGKSRVRTERKGGGEVALGLSGLQNDPMQLLEREARFKGGGTCLVLDTQGEIAKQSRIARTRLMLRCPAKGGEFLSVTPEGMVTVLRGGVRREARGRDPAPGAAVAQDGQQDEWTCRLRGRGGPAVFVGATEQGEERGLPMRQDLKRMMLEMNAFACEIVRGDSSLSGVEQFWKLDYNI